MPLKYVEVNGEKYIAAAEDGNPILVDDSGVETAFDVARAQAKVSELIGEVRSHKSAKQDAEKALKAFEGIADPSAALKALETVQNLDAKKLIDAGEVEALKANILKASEEKVAAANEVATKATRAFERELLGNKFLGSKYIADNLTVPGSAAQDMLGKFFKVEDGREVAHGPDGNPIYSKARPGELADFEEALPQLIDSLSYKDTILKGRQQAGGGARPGGGAGGGRSIPQSEFDAMGAKERSAFMADGGTLTE